MNLFKANRVFCLIVMFLYFFVSNIALGDETDTRSVDIEKKITVNKNINSNNIQTGNTATGVSEQFRQLDLESDDSSNENDFANNTRVVYGIDSVQPDVKMEIPNRPGVEYKYDALGRIISIKRIK